MQTHIRLLAVAIFLVSIPAAALANSSAYSDLHPNLEGCQTILADDDGGIWQCPGFEAYPVYFKEGHLRTSAFFGPIVQVLIDSGFETFGPFNGPGSKIEWRLNSAGRPFAAILRYHVSDPEGAETAGQVLVVSRVAQPEDGLSCVVGYVDARANRNANELARQVADEDAADFACGYNEAVWYGERGSATVTTSSNLPDSLKRE